MWIKLIPLLLQERFPWLDRLTDRIPESHAIMDSPFQVMAFDNEGSSEGVMAPMYEFNARELSKLLPPNGRLLDVGSGSGRLLFRLSELRPDIQITGVDPSQPMLNLARSRTQTLALQNRVQFHHGGIECLTTLLQEHFDAISAIFLLHHLDSGKTLSKFFLMLSRALSTSSTNLWIFDFVRPRSRRTAFRFPEIATPQSLSQFKEDTTNSLLAAFSFEQVRNLLTSTGLSDLDHYISKPFGLYQIIRRASVNISQQMTIATPTRLEPKAQKVFDWISKGFPACNA